MITESCGQKLGEDTEVKVGFISKIEQFFDRLKENSLNGLLYCIFSFYFLTKKITTAIAIKPQMTQVRTTAPATVIPVLNQ